jgi:DNA-binding Lrp family transcriptional regulator
MAIGFVLIKAAPKHEHHVYIKILQLPEVIELHPLFGKYDLLAVVKAEDFEELGGIITNKIRTVKGVIDTKTLTGTKF